MKVLMTAFVMVLFQAPVLSQTLPEWQRVYTFDDKSVVELNTDYVMFSTDQTSRVRFRWTFVNLQNLGSKKQIKYQSSIIEYQFDCQNSRFRLFSNEYFDTKGKKIHSQTFDLT